MADNQLLVTLGLESSSFSKQVKGVNSELKNLDKEISYIDKSTDGYGKSIEGLNKKYELQQKQVGTLNARLEAQQGIVDKNKKSIESKRAEIEKLTKKYGEESEEVKRANEQLKRYEEMLIKSERQVSLTEAEIDSMNRTLSETEKAIKQQPFDELSKSLDHAGTRITKVGDVLTNIGTKLSMVSAAVSGFGVGIFKMADEFQSGMNKVNTLINVSSDELSRYGDALKSISKDTGKPLNELTETMYQAISAGVDLADATTVVEAATKLAIGGFTDSASAVDINKCVA